jgi:hypothetical protein
MVEPKYPWRLDTNDRYREVVRILMGLSTASLLLPVFLARELLGLQPTKPLTSVLGSGLYWAWGLLAFAIFAGVVFHILSAKWVRMAWGQSAGFFGVALSENIVERAMEWSFWLTTLSFLAGLLLTVTLFAGYAPPG